MNPRHVVLETTALPTELYPYFPAAFGCLSDFLSASIIIPDSHRDVNTFFLFFRHGHNPPQTRIPMRFLRFRGEKRRKEIKKISSSPLSFPPSESLRGRPPASPIVSVYLLIIPALCRSLPAQTCSPALGLSALQAPQAEKTGEERPLLARSCCLLKTPGCAGEFKKSFSVA